MYFSRMRTCDLLGVPVNHCHERKNYRVVFYTEKWPGGFSRSFNLILMNRGLALFKIRDASFTARRNDLVLWAQGELREFRPKPGFPVSYDVINFSAVQFPGKTMDTETLDLPPHFRVTSLRRVRPCFQAVLGAFKRKGPFRQQESSIACLDLLRLLRETYQRPDNLPKDLDMPMDGRIADALNYIGANIKARLKISELAGRAGMHPAHFNLLFKQATSLAPNRYILEKKIEKAKDFLALYGDQPASTSIEFGFYDYSHFYRTFKRLTGMSPSKFLKRQGRKSH
jgi:AraC-like DNA-binding protein